jgi:hypothetical protein
MKNVGILVYMEPPVTIRRGVCDCSVKRRDDLSLNGHSSDDIDYIIIRHCCGA